MSTLFPTSLSFIPSLRNFPSSSHQLQVEDTTQWNIHVYITLHENLACFHSSEAFHVPCFLLPSLFFKILQSDELDHPESTFLIQNINTFDFLWTAESKESKQADQRNRSACGLGRSWLPLGCLDVSPPLQFPQARGCPDKHRLPSPIAQCPLPSKTCYFSIRPKAHDRCLSQPMGTPSLALQTLGVCQSRDNLAVSQLVGVAFLDWWLQW